MNILGLGETFFDQMHAKYKNEQRNRNNRQVEIDKIRSDIKKKIELYANAGQDSCTFFANFGMPYSCYQCVKVTKLKDVNEICKEFMDEGFGVSYCDTTHSLYFAWDIKYTQTEVKIVYK